MVAMAFLSLFEADILNCGDFAEVTMLFAEKPSTMYMYSLLMQRARGLYEEIGTSKLAKLRDTVTVQVSNASEDNNKERMVRQMVKETHLTEADIAHLHERFMELEAQARAQKANTGRLQPKALLSNAAAGKPVRQRRGSVAKLKAQFKKTELVDTGPDTIYEDREIDFDTFKLLIQSELPQWGRSSDDESMQKLFHAFDGDGSGTIGVSEFISGLAIFSAGDIDHKLRMIFRTTDADGSGNVELAEMLKLFQDCYRLFYPTMSQSNIPELVQGIFKRLEVDPVAGLNFEEFCAVVKSQPLLLECFSLDALDERHNTNKTTQAHENASCSGRLMVEEGGKKKAKFKDRWFVLSEGVLSYYASEDDERKGKRLGRVDLRSIDVEIALPKTGGGKTGQEELLHIIWMEMDHHMELRCTEPPSYTYDFSKGLKEATELHRWHDILHMYVQAEQQQTHNSGTEMETLAAVPANVLEQLLRFAVMALNRAQSESPVVSADDLEMAEDAVAMALEEVPTVSEARHGAIKSAALQVIKMGGNDSSILAMVRRGCAYEQVEELLNPLGFGTAKAKVFYTVVSEFVQMERASAFHIVEHTREDGSVELEAQAQGNGLGSVAIFSTLTAEVRDCVSAAFSTCVFETGEMIFLQGAQGDAMYLIIRGDVEVVINLPGGEEKVVAVLGPGHCFGEMSLLSSEVRSASMRCRGPSVCCVLTIEAYHELVVLYPALKDAMLAVASERAAFLSGTTRRALSKISSKQPPAVAQPTAPLRIMEPQPESEPQPEPEPEPEPQGRRQSIVMSLADAQALLIKTAQLESRLEEAVLDEDFTAVSTLGQQIESNAMLAGHAQALVDAQSKHS